MRHWKQHWDPDADLVFLRSMKIGEGVKPGDPVTPAMRQQLGLPRLRRFWRAQVVGLADFDPTSRSRKIEATITCKGHGWYNVLLPNGEFHENVRTRKAAEDLCQ